SELLPKSLAVIRPRALSAMVGVPLAATVRALDPVIGIFQTVNLLSRRLIWPGFQPEPYLAIRDLERAVELSSDDAHLVEQEQAVLQNIVSLSEIRVDELMRPRIQFMSFHPPVALADLKGRMPPGGYLMVTEPDSEEVAAAIALNELSEMPEEHLEFYAEEVLYVPWSATVGAALEEMRTKDRRVAAVVNEFGETLGILTLDDILDTIFTPSPSRSERILDREPIQQVSHSTWHVTGMTSLRRLGRFFHCELPASKSVTVAGILQVSLQRLPAPGDTCAWGPFRFKVIDVPERGQLVVELTAKDREVAS
ncbi:MAG: CBS domain-containing protein, partial [Planctomycetes bacterium]|nr:CBS domain-containing protein [Planctomycetota bacterium]